MGMERAIKKLLRKFGADLDAVVQDKAAASAKKNARKPIKAVVTEVKVVPKSKVPTEADFDEWAKRSGKSWFDEADDEGEKALQRQLGIDPDDFEYKKIRREWDRWLDEVD